MQTKAQAVEALLTVKQFFSADQRDILLLNMGSHNEERQFFIDLSIAYATRIKSMPHTYQTDGQGDAVLVQLHYFLGRCHWYITEKDIDTDGEGQVQAFGPANLGDPQCAELGYVSIKELVELGAEMDLYWTPKPLADVKAKVLA